MAISLIMGLPFSGMNRTALAETYREQGIEFLPVMGNHALNDAYTTKWIANMRNFIAVDAQHMPGYEWIKYT